MSAFEGGTGSGCFGWSWAKPAAAANPAANTRKSPAFRLTCYLRNEGPRSWTVQGPSFFCFSFLISTKFFLSVPPVNRLYIPSLNSQSGKLRAWLGEIAGYLFPRKIPNSQYGQESLPRLAYGSTRQTPPSSRCQFTGEQAPAPFSRSGNLAGVHPYRAGNC